MKKVIILTLVGLLLFSTVHVTSSPTIRVLIDESRMEVFSESLQQFFVDFLDYPADTDWRYSFENTSSSWGFGNAAKRMRRVSSVDIKESGKLNYSELRDYDVLVIASFVEEYTPAEAEAIKKFVENGGGLLLLADRDAPHESIASYFGIQFCSQQVVIADKTAETFSDSVRQFFITDIRDHPVTKNVNQIALNEGVPILAYGSGEVLARTSENSWIDKFSEGKTDTKESDEDEGSYAVLVVQTIKKGRTVFFGCAGSFFNWVVEEPDQQNLELLANAVKWLGEPGGPYKQYRNLNEQAQQVMQTAQSLYEENSFSEAESEFKKSEDLFDESNEIYSNATAEEGIQEAETYIEKCETGLEADEIFEKAEALYTARDYEKAIEEYEKAKLLYEEIGYTERAQICNTRTEESKNQIALREEATRLFQEAEEALAAAPSTFDPSGYEKAQSLFAEARITWEEYGDPGKVAACEENIDLCTEEISKIKNSTMIFIVGIVVVVVVVIVVVVIVVRRKPSAAIPPEPEELIPEQEEPLQEPEETPLEILKSRYQRGEITEEEYERLKLALESD